MVRDSMPIHRANLGVSAANSDRAAVVAVRYWYLLVVGGSSEVLASLGCSVITNYKSFLLTVVDLQ
jgi:hypothetical protein